VARFLISPERRKSISGCPLSLKLVSLARLIMQHRCSHRYPLFTRVLDQSGRRCQACGFQEDSRRSGNAAGSGADSPKTGKSSQNNSGKTIDNKQVTLVLMRVAYRSNACVLPGIVSRRPSLIFHRFFVLRSYLNSSILRLLT
jgi:hypothetical protein